MSANTGAGSWLILAQLILPPSQGGKQPALEPAGREGGFERVLDRVWQQPVDVRLDQGVAVPDEDLVEDHLPVVERREAGAAGSEVEGVGRGVG